MLTHWPRLSWTAKTLKIPSSWDYVALQNTFVLLVATFPWIVTHRCFKSAVCRGFCLFSFIFYRLFPERGLWSLANATSWTLLHRASLCVFRLSQPNSMLFSGGSQIKNINSYPFWRPGPDVWVSSIVLPEYGIGVLLKWSCVCLPRCQWRGQYHNAMEAGSNFPRFSLYSIAPNIAWKALRLPQLHINTCMKTMTRWSYLNFVPPAVQWTF